MVPGDTPQPVPAPTFSYLQERGRQVRVVSVDPVERLSVELEHALPSQPQIAPTVRVDGHDALALKPVFFREVLQRLTVISPGTLLDRSDPDVASTVFSD